MVFSLYSLQVSIVIPTRNRASMLEACLEGVANQECSVSLAQVIVVDNGDDAGATRLVAEKAAKKLPITYLFSDVSDVSRARNRGLAEATGDITVFLDDDEIPHLDWLTEMLGPFVDSSANADIVAGNYVPDWEVPRPSWLSEKYFGVYSAGLDLGDTPRLLTAGEWVLEGNIGVKTNLLRDAGGFDEKLGRKGQSLISGEGIVYQQLVRNGARLFYNPRCAVTHRIHAHRISKQWLQKRMFAAGATAGLHFRAGSLEARPIPPVKIDLGALAYWDIGKLEGEELLHANQIFEILGYICATKNLI